MKDCVAWRWRLKGSAGWLHASEKPTHLHEGLAWEIEPLFSPRPEGLEKMQAEVARLQLLINTPELEDFDKAVPLECAHQIERWGDAHDRSKSAENWYWLVGYLAGKALRAAIDGDREKSLHHTISAAAALRNWHRAIQQDTTGAGLGADADLDAIAESTAEFKR